MPSTVVPRGERFAARMVVDGRERWLGTFDAEGEARAAVERERLRVMSARAGQHVRRRDEPEGSRCPSRAEVDAILGAVQHEAFRVFLLMLAWSGLRLSEAAALRPADVVCNGGPVARVVVRNGKRLPGGPPRRRTALLYSPGLEAVRAMKLEVLGARRPRELLFVNAVGNPWSRQQVARKFERACRRAGVGGVTAHGCRKFLASWLLDQGASELDVACQLGHFRRDGRPHVDLIRKVYGFPSADAALERLSMVGG